jgi:proline iminopeptidase
MGPGYAPDYLYPVRDRLSASFQTVLIHLRGTGKSAMTELSPSTMTMDLVLRDIEAVREHLRLERASVMGNSFGGIISMSYAVRYPERVTALVLVGSGGLSMRFTQYFRANIRSRLLPFEANALDYWSEPERLQSMPARSHYEMIRITVPAYFYDREKALGMMETLSEKSFNRQVSDLLWMDLAQSNYDLSKPLARLTAPTLIIIGRQDIVGETTAYEIDHAIPNSELVFIEECGHFPWIEQPEQFYPRVEDFLSSGR